MIAVPIVMIALSAVQDGQPVRAAEPAEIAVTAQPPQTSRVAPTGSRVARDAPPDGSRIVATGTGVAGLTPGSGMDPFAGGTRTVVRTDCRSDDHRLSGEAACRLAAVQRLVASAAFDKARGAIDRLAASADTTDEERYVAAGMLYRVGEATGVAGDREDALRMMLATAAMPAGDRAGALRTLIAMSLGRGDRDGAMRLLEQLVAIAPDDSRSSANLAALYAERGRTAEAAASMRRAVAAARAHGETIPDAWLRFAAESAR